MKDGIKMGRYKVAITFELDDKDGSLEQEVQEFGMERIEKEVGLGFCDPEFENLTCKIEEVKNAE